MIASLPYLDICMRVYLGIFSNFKLGKDHAVAKPNKSKSQQKNVYFLEDHSDSQ